MQVTAYEIGLTTEQFWRTTPVEFARMVEGYQRRTRMPGVYFRELYALLYNVNRGEKSEALDGGDVLRLPGDKTKRKVRAEKAISYSMQELADYSKRINNQPT